MTTKKRRRRAKGIYQDAYGLIARVNVGTGDGKVERAKRFPFDTPVKEIRDWMEDERTELRRRQDLGVKTSRGTLAADVERYLEQVRQMTSYKSRVAELQAWTELYGPVRRAQLTAEHVRKARALWAAPDKTRTAKRARNGYTPKTINNRCQALQHLFHILDGKRAPTPVDEVDKLALPKVPKLNVPATTFRTVADALRNRPKTRARFLVVASTGVRPSELKRAEAADVDLAARTWNVRTGKGGDERVLFLNDDMVEAWKAFLAADAWGPYDGSTHAKWLYAAGWPRTIRPYQARHSTALELQERGGDIGDMQGFLGHKDPTITRKHYAPISVTRLKAASQRLEGRFGKWAPLEPADDGDTTTDLAAAPTDSAVH